MARLSDVEDDLGGLDVDAAAFGSQPLQCVKIVGERVETGFGDRTSAGCDRADASGHCGSGLCVVRMGNMGDKHFGGRQRRCEHGGPKRSRVRIR